MSDAAVFCGACGVTVAPESHFCVTCGKPLHVAHVATAAQVPGQADAASGPKGETASMTSAPASDPLISRQQIDELKAIKDLYLPKLLAQFQLIGKPLLGAVAVIAFAWIWLPALSVHLNAAMTQSVTMFDLMRLVNAGSSLENLGQAGGSSGLYGLICVLCMLAPLAHVFLPQKWARYGLFAPLGFMLLTGIGIYSKIHSLASAATDSMRSFGGSQMGDMAGAMMNQVMAAMSIGAGSYVALAAALFLAWAGIGKFRARN